MISLRSLAAHNLPDREVLPEVVARDILTQTSKEIREINKKIGKEDGKYQKMFNRYVNTLDPVYDFTNKYAQKLGEECLYDIMRRISSEFKSLYHELPENFDESTEWFAYFEYMFFRVFPESDIWYFDPGRAYQSNSRLIITIRGIHQIISETPRPSGTVPQDLTSMDYVFKGYAEHIKNLNQIVDKKFSHSNVFRIQKEYVSVYEERTRIKTILKKSKEFYEKIKKNMYSSIFVPSVLR